MANRSIVVRFATRNIDKAKRALTEARKLAREGIKGIKDKKERAAARAEQKSLDIQHRELLADAKERQRGDARSKRARRRSRAGALADPKVRSAGTLAENARTFFGGGGLGSISVAASAAGPLAAAAALAWDAFGRPYVEAAFRGFERERLDPIIARIQRIEAENLKTRLEQDIDFQDQIGAQASAQNRAINEAIAAKRVVRSSVLSRLTSGS